MDFQEFVNKYFHNKVSIDSDYTYERALIDVRNKLDERNRKKILEFNKNIEYSYDLNGFPKIIHFTLKDKNNIDNSIWRDCLKEYEKIYSDYKIIIYDNNDIYNIVQYFNKKHIEYIKKIKKGAILADVFRYLILYLRGGYYSDMDCFPYKRIDELSETQYHGDSNNNIYIYHTGVDLPNNQYCFYSNPCSNCNLVYNNTVFNKKPLKVYKCSGHNYINADTSIIVGYEFDKTWHKDLVTGPDKNSWVTNGIGICQWFIGAKPQEKLFMKCYKRSLQNTISTNLNNKNNFHYNVINSTGPLFFTRVINQFLNTERGFKDKLCILPADYFCCGSGNKVPSTKNKFIQHKFTGTWLK